ncbi:hypothetical protein ACFXTI_007410 [Malus domestica]
MSYEPLRDGSHVAANDENPKVLEEGYEEARRVLTVVPSEMEVVDEGVGLDVEGEELVRIFLESRATGVLVLRLETDEDNAVFGVGGLGLASGTL